MLIASSASCSILVLKGASAPVVPAIWTEGCISSVTTTGAEVFDAVDDRLDLDRGSGVIDLLV